MAYLNPIYAPAQLPTANIHYNLITLYDSPVITMKIVQRLSIIAAIDSVIVANFVNTV